MLEFDRFKIRLREYYEAWLKVVEMYDIHESVSVISANSTNTVGEL